VIIMLTVCVAYNEAMMNETNLPLLLKEPDAFSDVRGRDSIDDKETATRFWWFFNHLVPCIAGKKVWTPAAMVSKTITDGKCVTTLDEAFTVLCIENYWEKWINKGTTKWTGSRSGNTGFMGWEKAAYDRFVTLCKRIKKQRAETYSKELEKDYMVTALSEYGATGLKVRRSLGEDNVATYEELDEE
jgi:hypothetical protein